jgi:2-polyprenyl-3-methyl-5-hydroxy-6-metoxy-1,4-benzoquinol methylase
MNRGAPYFDLWALATKADLNEEELLSWTNNRFDLIESVGVLHHLENPFEGLKVLQSLLKPHGLMKLGFYSEIARKGIVKVRDMIAKEGVGSSAQEIRSYRKHLLELKKSEDFGISTNSSDFFVRVLAVTCFFTSKNTV